MTFRNGYTVHWRGLMLEDDTKADGLSIADLREFLAEADRLADLLGVKADAARPLVLLNDGSTIRHIWAGLQYRRWAPFRNSA